MNEETRETAADSGSSGAAEKPFRSGFLHLLGRTNAGKSTLLNALVGEHVAATAEVPQTTRHRIMALRHEPGRQMIFVDLPGVHRPLHRMNERMMGVVRRSLLEAPDVVLFVVDASEPFGAGDAFALDLLKGIETPAVLALNKCDRARKPALLPMMDMYMKAHPFRAAVPISALRGEGLDALLDEIRALLPEGPRYFPEGYLTDRPEVFVMEEFIREALMKRTREEVPHSMAVEIQNREESEGLLRVEAAVLVEKESQKAIVIGEGGRLIKAASTEARKTLEDFAGKKVFLRLWVQVRPGWRDSEQALDRLGITSEY
jgi:GTP-binding protein Era